MMRTDLPLDPVPFAERMDSDLWESLIPRKHHPIASITLEDAAEIRRAHTAGEATMRDLGRWYGISISRVHKIIHDHAYRKRVA